MARSLDSHQQIQEDQYDFPYHYIPSLGEGVFSQVRYWSWGYRYLGGIDVVLEQLAGQPFESLVDIGCGDGRFLREVASHYPESELMGVDYSAKAIRMAKTLNPGLRYEVVDVVHESLSRQFDVTTLIEVLEHIPPGQLDSFCEGVARALKSGGRLILTVPHVNKPVNTKHYQHFSSCHLRELLGPHFIDIAIIPFDVRSRLIMPLLTRLIGGNGHHFILTNRKLLSLFYRVYRSHYLYAAREEDCGRLAAVCRKG